MRLEFVDEGTEILIHIGLIRQLMERALEAAAKPGRPRRRQAAADAVRI